MFKNKMLFFLLVFCLFPVSVGAKENDKAPLGKDRQHLIFWAGTPQELEVYKIFGRQEGPTIMILGGIQGDEPGGFLSADLYADLALKRGNLIVVPRANFKSILSYNRGSDGDMNRKFKKDLAGDPDQEIVVILKNLMAESDVFLNLHDGSGFYRPIHEDELANPNRYGQCIIADTEVYFHESSGRRINLKEYAEEAVRRINQDISEPRYRFHFFNTKTNDPQSKHHEQENSATYYALTQLGIPSFGLETSKQLPTLEMKVHQHNLAVNAFMEIFGVEVEQPRINLEPPLLSYLIISVNDALPIAIAGTQKLLLAPGDTIEIIHVGANYDRGLSVDVADLGGMNDLRRRLTISKPTRILVQKDHNKIGLIEVGLLASGQRSPQVEGVAKLTPPKQGTPIIVSAAPDTVKEPAKGPGIDQKTENGQALAGAAALLPSGYKIIAAQNPPPAGPISGFLMEVDGHKLKLLPGQRLEVVKGSLVKIVDFEASGTLPEGVVLNLKGFIANPSKNDGEDRGGICDTGQDLLRSFSSSAQEEIYPLAAERTDNTTIAQAEIKVLPVKLASVELTVDGKNHKLKLGGRLTKVKPGSQIVVKKINLVGGLSLSRPHLTLGGKKFSSDLPQTLGMSTFAVSLAVWNGSSLAGKVVLAP